jgi:predicted secreted protein
MTAAIGRSYLVKKGATALAGVRTKSLSINHEPVDITTDDEDGFRTLLGAVGESSFELSVDGVSKDSTLFDEALGSSTKLLTDVTIEHPNGIISGDVFLASYEETGAYNDAITFSATFQSSGEWSVGTA